MWKLTFAFLQVLLGLLKQTWQVYHHAVACNGKCQQAEHGSAKASVTLVTPSLHRHDDTR